METALEEGYHNGRIVDYLGHAEAGDAVWIFSSDEAAIRALIPRFTTVIADMITRVWSRYGNLRTWSGITLRR